MMEEDEKKVDYFDVLFDGSERETLKKSSYLPNKMTIHNDFGLIDPNIYSHNNNINSNNFSLKKSQNVSNITNNNNISASTITHSNQSSFYKNKSQSDIAHGNF